MRRLFASGVSIAFVVLAATARPDDACTTWEVEYELTGTLRISNTTLGAGDGSHIVGPGKLVLWFDGSGNVTVASYEMTTHFTVDAHFLGIGTTVANDTLTKSTGTACAPVAKGFIGDDRVVRWQGPWTGIRTDGTLTCSGTCGRFGAPPRGRSELHMAPHSVAFGSLVFTASRIAFYMSYAVVDKTSNDTASLSLSGRETRRSCFCPPPCV